MLIKLKDLCKVSKGIQINGNDLLEEGEYPFFNGGVEPSGYWSDFNVPANSISISEGGASCGTVIFQKNPFFCGAHCYYLSDLKCNVEYLYYCLKAKQNDLMQLRSGVCMPNIRKSELENFEIFFDDNENNQVKIVEELNKINDLIDIQNQKKELLYELINSKYYEIKDAYNNKNVLGDFINTYSAQKNKTGIYPILSITKEYGIILQDEKFKKRIASVDTSKYKIVPRGILVQGIHIDERNFGIQNVVDFGIVSPAYKLWNVDCCKANPELIAYVLRSDEMMNYIKTKFNGAVKRRENISNDDFLSAPINIPPLEAQNGFISYKISIEELIEEINNKIKHLVELSDKKMYEYFG